MSTSETVGEPAKLSQTQIIAHNAGKLLSRKIWLPKILYTLLPYFYLVSGIAALFATLYISNWLWLLPHYLLFAAGCLHLGAVIYRRRHRARISDT